jgi:hypothetical protein
MGRLRHTISSILLVLSLLAPTMACAMPSAQMDAAEQACCKQMGGGCGSMRMQHSCCRSTFDKGTSQLQQAVEPWSHSGFTTTSIPVPVHSFRMVQTESRDSFASGSSPPPEAHPGAIQILRV